MNALSAAVVRRFGWKARRLTASAGHCGKPFRHLEDNA